MIFNCQDIIHPLNWSEESNDSADQSELKKGRNVGHLSPGAAPTNKQLAKIFHPKHAWAEHWVGEGGEEDGGGGGATKHLESIEDGACLREEVEHEE